MKRWVLLFGVMLLFAGIASAQEENPKVEVFGGYSYLRLGESWGSSRYWTPSTNGGSASVSFNPVRWFGIVGDVGGYTAGTGSEVCCAPSNFGLHGTIYSYLFGPKVAFRTSKVTLFAQTLFGGAHVTGYSNINPEAIIRPAVAPHPDVSAIYRPNPENTFAAAFGGGVDWNATSHIGIRLAQVEYLLTQFADGFTGRQNNLRVSAGVVFRF